MSRPEDLTNFEKTLSALNPTPMSNRDRILFEAGRRSQRPTGWLMATAVLSLMVAVLAVDRIGGSRNQPLVQVILPPDQGVPTTVAQSFDDSSYLKRRNAVLKDGIDSLQLPAFHVKPENLTPHSWKDV